MKIAIIGSGLAGMTAASELAPHHDVTVFEKSRGASGRMCTRRRKDEDGTAYAFDHGAQYFTIRGEAFRQKLTPLMEAGIVKPWETPMVTMTSDGQTSPRQHAAYVACPGMTALAKAIGQDIPILHELQISALHRQDGQWILTDQHDQTHGPFDLVVSAIPSHQAALLMPALAVNEGIDQVKMMACFTVMLGFQHDLNLDWGGAFIEDHPLGFIAVNSTKPDRGSTPCLVVQANNKWAEPRIEEDPEIIEAQMHDMIRSLTGIEPKEATLTSFHRWRYAATKTPLGRSHILDQDQGLAMIGDWCLKGRVEAAFDSGLALAQDLLNSTDPKASV